MFHKCSFHQVNSVWFWCLFGAGLVHQFNNDIPLCSLFSYFHDTLSLSLLC